MNHLSKSNRFLLSQFVYLYSSKLIGVDCPSVAQSSAGVNLTRQLIPLEDWVSRLRLLINSHATQHSTIYTNMCGYSK